MTVEEASIGGLGAHVLTLASDEGLLDAGLKIRTMRLPDRFQEHDKPDKQYDEAGLNAPHIVDTVLKALRVEQRRRRGGAGLRLNRSAGCSVLWFTRRHEEREERPHARH